MSRFDKTIEFAGRRWQKVRGEGGRVGRIVKGDILMTPKNERLPLSPENVMFAIATGDGFGTSPDTMGRAIYVEYERRTMEDTVNHTGDGWDQARWQADWTIYRLVKEGEK